jgi:hypothetical protein
MKHEKKFLAHEQQTRETHLHAESRQTIHEFATPEEALRFDAKQTLVPDNMARRLSRSAQKLPRRPWWKQWLG